jgi:hypothetical protein
MPAVIDLCYYYLCYDTYLLRIYLLSGRALLLGAEPFSSVWVVSKGHKHFLYNTSLHFVASCLPCGRASHQICTITPNTIMSLHCYTVALPITLNLAWHYSLLAPAYFTFSRFACRLKREANSSLPSIGDDEYIDEQQHHHHHQAPPGAPPQNPQDDVRQSHVFPGYSGSYPPNPSVGGASMAPNMHSSHGAPHSSHPIAARSHSHSHSKGADELNEDERASLFGDIPEAKKRKFILVDDPGKGGRVRVRVTLDTVDIKEIPDSFRKSNSVYPRSWFPLQMQSPPPSAHGSRFFEGDDEDDTVEVDGGRAAGSSRGRGSKGKMMVSVPLADGGEAEVGVPRMRKSVRSKEVRLNDLGYRMTWHQSRVFADKTVFLQKARE